MNTTYNILWIDDSEDFRDATEELINDTVEENYMTPNIQCCGDYIDFQHNILYQFGGDIFNRFDLIIVDYALSGVNGDQIIKDLRSREIYTDVIFYSSEYNKLRTDMRSGDLLDGVFFVDRNNLTSKINQVIKKNIRREYSIENIRGILMDNSSEFDYICRITAVDLFEYLPQQKQAEIIAKAQEYVDTAKQTSLHNFQKIEKKQGYKYVKAAMESTEYVISNKHRYELMSMIVRSFDFADLVDEEFAEKYNIDIIIHRNKLAHSKLYYGNCQKKLLISKERELLQCNEDCDNCRAPYDVESCENMRKCLFEYYQLFKKLNEDTSTFLVSTAQKELAFC